MLNGEAARNDTAAEPHAAAVRGDTSSESCTSMLFFTKGNEDHGRIMGALLGGVLERNEKINL